MWGTGNNREKEIERFLEDEQKELKENRLKWTHYLISILFVLTGAVFIVVNNIELSFVCRFLSFVFIVAGIVSVISYCVRDVAIGYYRLDLVYGIMAGFIALIINTRSQVFETYFPVIIGIVLFANGVAKLQHSIDMKRIDRKMKKVTEMWLVVMIFALMCIAAGTVAVYMIPTENRSMFLFIGIALVVAGASDVFTHIVFNKKVKLFRSGNYITEEKSDTESKPETETVQETAEEPVITEDFGNTSESVSEIIPDEVPEEVPTIVTEEPFDAAQGDQSEETTDEADQQA